MPSILSRSLSHSTPHLQTEEIYLVYINSCLCCTNALAVCFNVVRLVGLNIKSKWCSHNANLQLSKPAHSTQMISSAGKIGISFHGWESSTFLSQKPHWTLHYSITTGIGWHNVTSHKTYCLYCARIICHFIWYRLYQNTQLITLSAPLLPTSCGGTSKETVLRSTFR